MTRPYAAAELGDANSRLAYVSFLLAPFGFAAGLAVLRPLALLTVLVLPLTMAPVRAVRGGAHGPGLIRVLGLTARVQLIFGIALAIGLAARLHGWLG